MISDVGAPNDFFLKPEASRKPAEPTEQATVTSKKNEFDKSLKSASGEPKTRAEKRREIERDPAIERFSNGTRNNIEAPIQKRVPQSEKPQPNQAPDLDSASEQNSDVYTPKSRFIRPIQNQNIKAAQNEGVEEIESIDDSATKEASVEPNIQLLAILASPKFDVKDLSPSQLKEVKETLRDQQAEMKQASVQKFMSQLQTQFGITPEKVVQAFAKMDEKTLTAPPSETVSQFVNNLNVKGPARQQIANLYKQMLNETGEAALNEKLLGNDDSKSVSLKVVDSTQAKLDQLNKSLDSLNDNFFRKGQFQPQNNQQLPASIKEQLKSLTQSPVRNDDNDSPNSLGAMLSRLGTEASGLAAASGGAGAVTATGAGADTAIVSGAGASADVGAMSAAPPVMDMSSFTKINPSQSSGSQNFGQGESSKDDGGRGAKAYLSQSVSQNSTQNAGAKNFADAAKLNLKNADSKVTMASTSSSTSSAGATSIVGGTAVAGSTAAALNPAQMMATGPTKQETTENVQELIKQAQVIIKKGGGEMNIEMKPEGMGQVHLKVALENGQVNIQMMAQNDKVKKLLEEGIHELKTNLAAHKLQVESLKVGIASGALSDKKLDQQQSEAQREAMRDAQREMAGNFAGEMRDQRQDRNSGFADVPGWKAYRNDPKRVSVESAPEQPNVKRRDEGRRLSLVA